MRANAAKQQVKARVKKQIEEWEASVAQSLRRNEVELMRTWNSAERTQLKLQIETQSRILDFLHGRKTNVKDGSRDQRDEVISLRMELTASQNELKEANDHLKVEQKIHRDLKLQLDEYRTKLPVERDENRKLTAQLQEAQDKNQKLTAQLQEEQDKNQELTAKLQEQQNKNQELTAKLQEQQDKNQELMAKLQEQQNKNQELTAKLQEAQKQLQEASRKASLDELSEKLLEAQDQQVETENRSCEILNAAEEPTESLQSLELQAAATERPEGPEGPDIVESSDEADDSEEELEENKVDVSQTGQIFSSFASANMRASEQANKVNSADMPLASNKAPAGTDSEVARELSRLAKLIKDTSETQDKKLDDTKRSALATETKLPEIFERLNHVESRLAFLEEANQEFRERPPATREEMERLGRKPDDIENRERRNNLRWPSLRRNEVELMRTWNSAERTQLKLQIETQSRILDFLHGRKTNVKDGSRDQRDEVISLRMELTASQNELKEANDHLKVEQKIHRDLKLQLDEYRTKLPVERDENRKLTAQLQEAQDKNQKLTAQLQEEQDKNQELTAKLQEQQNKNQELTAKLQEQQDKNQELMAKLQEQQTKTRS
ncbi:filamin A-interacting protein 1-like [Amphiprion ocellaris]|uniref:filamin A-interacting protein 1-like n=1 Tax=Amphiprion ocellaris TaxID=80972 RepID=UPI002410FCA3|nr:filamin A-interacting protein 1-like [Amphiprion ocellaris]